MSSDLFTLISILLVFGLLAFGIKTFSPKNLKLFCLLVTGLLILEGGVGYTEFLVPKEPGFPRFILVPITLFVLIFSFSRSEFSRDLARDMPAWFLVAFQGFRVLPEAMLHLSYVDGLAPVQMTWHGLNFDIVTALVAPIFAFAIYKTGRLKLLGWTFSVLGLGLLITIVAIALLSAPLPIRYFMNEPASTFVGTFPYIYLPGIHVLFAATMHVVLIKKMLGSARPD